MEKINFVNNSEPYLSAENLNQMQDNIENAINGDVIWENANPTEVFAGQTIVVDTSKYTKFYVLSKIREDDDTVFGVYIPYKGVKFALMGYAYEPNTQMDLIAWRKITISSDNTNINVSNGEGYGVSSSVGFHQNLNNLMIPYQIIGYK